MLLNIDIEYEKHYKSISKMASVLPLNKHIIYILLALSSLLELGSHASLHNATDEINHILLVDILHNRDTSI